MQLISTHTVMSGDLGIYGNLFGGQLLAWFDLATAAFAAQTIKSTQIVTLKFSECVFHRPGKINNIIKIYGEVVCIGKTSITIAAEARRNDVVNNTEELICSTQVVFVHIGDDEKPRAIETA